MSDPTTPSAHAAHLVHDELDSPSCLTADCQTLLSNHHQFEQAALRPPRPAPSIQVADYPRGAANPLSHVSDSTIKWASSLPTGPLVE